MGLRRTLLVAGIGAALAYYLDPVSGQDRRVKLQRMIDETLKKGGGNLAVPWRHEGAPANGEPEHERPIVTT
jgi:hypothetical protein